MSDHVIRSQPCPACGTEVHALAPRWVHDLEQRLAVLTDRHQPQPYTTDGQRHCNACGDAYPCTDAKILAGMAGADLTGQPREAGWTR